MFSHKQIFLEAHNFPHNSVVRTQHTTGLRRRPTLAIQNIKKICGDPRPEMELEFAWQEHELGNYPVSSGSVDGTCFFG
jgi:hypothetical protein